MSSTCSYETGLNPQKLHYIYLNKSIPKLKCDSKVCDILPANVCHDKNNKDEKAKKLCSYDSSNNSTEGVKGYYVKDIAYLEEEAEYISPIQRRKYHSYAMPIGCSTDEFGKFKDAESLLKAYTNLEAEFTKKSQRLASLESESAKLQDSINSQAEIEKRVDEFVTKFDVIKPFSSALKESIINKESASIEEAAVKILANNYKSAESFASDSEFLNNYIYSNQEIKDKILKDYLSKVTHNSPIKVETSKSSISLTPPNIPTTIQEAGRLAKSIIKQK